MRSATRRHPWSGLSPAEILAGKKLPSATDCNHRGDVLRLESAACCGGRVQIKIYACAVHGECALVTGRARNICPCPERITD
jgi:hypothetical protein